jgi:hypothetical protein
MNIRTFKGFVSDESNWNESVDGLTKEFSFSTQTDLAEFPTTLYTLTQALQTTLGRQV